MLKAIIVDDEMYIRKGLRMLIDWEREGILIAGEASNGKQGVSLMKEQRPDIVITDIKMPVMDGLDFIRHLRQELNSNAQIIVLSGYADFKFAQNAMKYGVKKYVLKPVDDGELLEALKDVKKDIEAGEMVEHESQISVQSRKSSTLKGILNGKGNLFQDSTYNGLFNIKKHSKYFCAIVNLKKKWYSSGTQACRNEAAQKSEMEILLNVVKAKGFAEFTELFEYENFWGLFVDYEIMLDRGLAEELFLNKLSEAVRAGFSNYACVFAGKVTGDFPNGLRSAFETACDVMKLSFYKNDKCLYRYTDRKDMPLAEDYNEEIFTGMFMDKMMDCDFEGIKAALEEIFTSLSEKRLDPEVIRIRLNYLVHKLVEAVAGIDGNYDRNPERYPVYNINYREINIDELKEMVSVFCMNTASYIREMKENISSGIAYKVKKYIDMNFAEDITLTKLALEFYVNTNYLGQIFKKIYNVKFNDYLNHVRIEEAKKLLQLTGMKAYEISRKVGYAKPEYFSRKFEEITGQNPSQYREGHVYSR